jgi:DNA-binding NtrC family response regulator
LTGERAGSGPLVLSSSEGRSGRHAGALREYAEDVPDLLRFYVDRLVDDQHLPLRRFSVAAQNRLRNYPWPGSVSELKNLVQRVLILGSGEDIRLEEIERKLAVDEPLVKQDLLALPLREAREQFERAYLQQQLLLCNGKVGQLAKREGMERTHLYRKCADWASIFVNWATIESHPLIDEGSYRLKFAHNRPMIGFE